MAIHVQHELTLSNDFQLHPGTTAFGNPADFAYLCRDGSWQPLIDNPEPCLWLNRPWPVVVAKR